MSRAACRIALLLLAAQLASPPDARAAADDDVRAAAAMRAAAVVVPPVIDGILDDAAWTAQPLPTGDWLSYNPLHGDRIPQQTTVWVAYDQRYLYFAFRCDDPEPAGIKTSVTRRDNIFSDDWVGLSLDALGTGQVSYHMMINPSGVQLDMLNTVSGNEDLAPDWIWDSAARVTDTGYSVEVRLPLQSIRFKGGAQVSMGILFWRRVSRTGVSVAWPALEPGRWVFEKHARIEFANLDALPTREVIPSTTYSRVQGRGDGGAWNSADHTGDFGFSAKYGLSSTVTLDATANPDFSQVESDSFQVLVNQRFPVFFSEKRPFFMEGAGVFTLAGNQNGDSSMYTAVHTRNIVDPIFGAKLTGTAGRFTFGTLSAVDQGPGRVLEESDTNHGREKVFNIARGQYSLGSSSYVGALVTDARFGGETNQVAGADLNWKIDDRQRLMAFALRSSSGGGARDERAGVAGQATYWFQTRRVNTFSQIEHYDDGFEMDTAFYNRVGFTSGWNYVDYNFYPDKDRYSWIRRVVPFTYTQLGRDRQQGGNEWLNVTGVRLNFTRQGFFRADYLFGEEPWAGNEYALGRVRVFGQVQLFRWLRVSGNVNRGKAIYYDDSDPFQGRSTNYNGSITFQPNGRLTQNVSWTRVDFTRADDGTAVYDLDIVNTRTTYQFTRSFYLRALVQYDGSDERILTDFLASHEVRPGTVVYMGYGSLYERPEAGEDGRRPGDRPYLTTQRGLFFKASYLHRF